MGVEAERRSSRLISNKSMCLFGPRSTGFLVNSCRIVSEVACIIFSLCRLAISFLSRCAAGCVAWPPSEWLAAEPRLCRLNSGGNGSFLIFRKGRTKPSSIRQDAQYDRKKKKKKKPPPCFPRLKKKKKKKKKK